MEIAIPVSGFGICLKTPLRWGKCRASQCMLCVRKTAIKIPLHFDNILRLKVMSQDGRKCYPSPVHRVCYPVYRTLEYSSTSDKTFLSKRSPFSIHFTLLCSDSVKMSWQAFVYFTKFHSAKRLKIYRETSLILPLQKNEPHLENHENASQGRVPSRCISFQHFKHGLTII